MGNLLFSPTGRIGASEFLKGAIILIVLAALLSLPQILGLPKALVNAMSLVSFLLMWCWIALWIKRYHDGGKSGWMCLVPIIVYIIVASLIIFFLAGEAMMDMIQAASAGADQAEMEALEAEFTAETAIPMMAASLVASFLIAFLFNAMIKQDQHDNPFGPYQGGDDTFS